MADLHFLTITQAAELLRTRQLSPVELTRAHLERIERLQPGLNAFITVTADLALTQAQAAEKEIMAGGYLGPLHGIPLGVKDLFWTKGVRTTAGAKILADFIPGRDATSLSRLLQAGMVMLGKLNTHEFAFGITTNNPHYGPTHNPWAAGHVPGGSSGGSGAALAAGLCLAATGTDTGGSIRIPAALCGIAGIKPTYGRVSRAGVVPLSFSLDHVGPMARSVADLAIMLQAMAGYDPQDPASLDVPVPDFAAGLDKGIQGWRLGVPVPWAWDNLDPEVATAFAGALQELEHLGAQVIEVRLPNIQASYSAYSAVGMSEAATYHAQDLEQRPQDYGDDVRQRLLTGSLVTATEYIRAQQARTLLRQDLLAALGQVDCLLTPTTALPAAPIGAEAGPSGIGVREGSVRFALPFNMAGLPAASVPCGTTQSGLPIGLQIVGRPLAEAAVLQAADAYTAATGWLERHPTL